MISMILKYKFKKESDFTLHPSRKHLRTKVTPDFHLTYVVKMGEIRGLLESK